MKLYAISDLHVRFEANRRALESLAPHPDDWLAIAGDVGETEIELAETLDLLASKFARLLWVPGNHELWTMPSDPTGSRGVRKYERLVELCRRREVLTPEDPYVIWPGAPPTGAAAKTYVIAPLFLLYDYSFRPDSVAYEDAIAWAEAAKTLCADEALLSPEPYASRTDWCAARCEMTEARLSALPPDCSTILVNHFPLAIEDVTLPRIPRFSLWCGTRQTRDWPERFRAAVVVYGHLHVRATRLRGGTRFEEVSLGYPGQRSADAPAERYLREILPGPAR